MLVMPMSGLVTSSIPVQGTRPGCPDRGQGSPVTFCTRTLSYEQNSSLQFDSMVELTDQRSYNLSCDWQRNTMVGLKIKKNDLVKMKEVVQQQLASELHG